MKNRASALPSDENLPDAEPVTLGEALCALDRQARLAVQLIASDPATALSTHADHADLAAIATAISDVLIALTKRRRM